ncbi:endolytic transglycosylase MltG [Hydrogenimonas urashimensis]|uniref:endolytic transglycosylase MltG n=1 Tax=Hydrogenimonas urashimensis TaxID=2740515 RepID=UPI0019167259|nr:endolytic transglycosylase MltG [Hydrogenimonas urashimensis]
MNRKSIVKTIFKSAEWTIFAVVVIIVSLAFYLVQPVKSNRVLFLPAGTGATIIAYLHRSGIDANGLDRYLLRFFGYPQQGWIDIGTTCLTKADFLYRLTHAKAAMTKVKLIPGETRVIFFDQLARTLKLDPKKLDNAYRRYAPYPDGVIWPDTYFVPMGITEEHLVYHLIKRSMARHERLSKKFFGTYNEKKWFRYVTIASIIQKEAADTREMPLVSAVIYNRMKKGMPLQMDGALNYGKYSHVKVTKRRIDEDMSRFNTYKYTGLPPSPVGSVSLDAIKAAIKPANVDYLYFVKGKNGKHIFTKRYKTHLRNIKSVNK